MTMNRSKQHIHASGRTPPNPKRPRHPRRGCRPSVVDACSRLTVEQRDALWSAYLADRGDLELRNRLVEHYLPWIRRVAASIARRMRLRDEENAIGEVLVALFTFIIPNYDGKRKFDRWARMCVRQKLIDQLRVERKEDAFIPRLPPGASAIATFVLPDREQPGCDLKFVEIAADLTDRQAAILWLRYYRGMSAQEVAAMMKTSPNHVAGVTFNALMELKNIWSGVMKDDLPSY